MDFKEAIKRLQEADSAGDLLGSMMAQKSAIIAKLHEVEDDRDFTSLMASLSRVTSDIIKQEGITRQLSEQDAEDIGQEDAIRKLIGKGGKGL